MTASSFRVKEIGQKDNFTFFILWTDDKKTEHRLSDLQKSCPCALCCDEVTGKQIVDQKTIDENVRARRIVSVGRYALRIEFTSGCVLGIYGFDFLRKIVT
jgi:ATP-binding protein involved in chromosome partitioning